MSEVNNLHIGSHAKIQVHWQVSPYDYSKEKESSIIFQASQKYNVSKDRIKIIPEFIVLNKNGEEMSVANEVVHNIQKPDFQVKLFKKYIVSNNIKGYDFDLIKSIDSEINAKIDYDVYDKYRKYRLKWIKWKNFLSYGDSNVFDFTNLNGMVLLNGEPANQSGKTTFAVDLTHFLFFGKTEKYQTQDKLFNKHLSNATEVVVEGCIEIDGQEYVIKRRLTRPSENRRTAKSKTVQKVEYYKINNGELTSLEDYIDNQQEENSIQTNKVIKEAIGHENDFDMIVCATSKNLDDLIEKKDTERGRLLSRWIGLLPIEQKEILAKEKFNSEIKPYLLSSRYNQEELRNEIKTCKENITFILQNIEKENKKISNIEEEIKMLEDNQKTLLSSKNQIDSSLLKVDIHTLERKIKAITANGLIEKDKLDDINNQLQQLENINFSIEDYNNLLSKKEQLVSSIASLRTECKSLQQKIKDLQTSEYCPTCGRKYDNVDNSAIINENKVILSDKIKEGSELANTLQEIESLIASMRENQEMYVLKCKLQAQKGAVEVNIEQFRNKLIECRRIKSEYDKNNEAIDKNNKLEIQINNNEAILKGKRNEREFSIRQVHTFTNDIANYEKAVAEREDLISKLNDEVVKVFNWKLYLEMIGKNGISKMVLRQVIPVINAQLTSMLNEICDFGVELDITDKNEVVFYLVKDGIRSDISGSSGFERTAAALALRAVLGNISTLPRMSCLVLDEIWGRVAKENYENLRKLIEAIGKSFDFILIISHLDEVKDFCNTVITVVKKDNVSSLKISSNQTVN